MSVCQICERDEGWSRAFSREVSDPVGEIKPTNMGLCAKCCDRGLHRALMKGISMNRVREGFLEEEALDQRLRGHGN